MPEADHSLRKKSRAELLEILVEQSEAVNQVITQKENLEKELQEKNQIIDQLREELNQKDEKSSASLRKMQLRLKKSNERIMALKTSLEAERMIRMKTLAEAKTISEACQYMNQLLEDTKVASILYQKLIMKLAREAKKHE